MFQNEISSSLFVDFDNIYLCLLDQDEHAAKAFATIPEHWLHWLETVAVSNIYGKSSALNRRRLLRKYCYLNTAVFNEFRPCFVRAGFTIVDCPPLTSRGKTAADTHLVIDCIHDLRHDVPTDESIIMSGDADFTPLLNYLNGFGKRTIIMPVGYYSSVYESSASWALRDQWFISTLQNLYNKYIVAE